MAELARCGGVGEFDLDIDDLSAAKKPFPFTGSYDETGTADKIRYYWENRDSGSVVVADNGCGHRAHLVLRGRFAGEDWISGWFLDQGMKRFGNYPSFHIDEAKSTDLGYTFDEWYSNGTRMVGRFAYVIEILKNKGRHA